MAPLKKKKNRTRKMFLYYYSLLAFIISIKYLFVYLTIALIFDLTEIIYGYLLFFHLLKKL